MMKIPSLNESANLLVRTKMFPYFDISNYILMCSMVRDDYAFSGPTNDPVSFPRKHPFSSWLSSMLLCFSSVILTNFLLGESPLAPFGSHRDLITATVIWYLVNFCPFDGFFKMVKLFPVHLFVSLFKEIQRANKVHHGIHYASKLYQHSFFIVCIVGVLKGSGYYFMRLFERLVRGTWTPNHHELLNPSGSTKTCLIASIFFYLNQEEYLKIPHALMYLLIVVFFISIRLLYLVWHVKNPFEKIEKFVCSILFGGVFDNLKKITSQLNVQEENLRKKNQLNIKKEF